jgi:hypothetical protein
MPTPTDLVTDLPADFEVFGQAVDSSMADLLGGTTGQVLAKNSNTDMDFVWVAQDDSNAIQNAIVDAKGDLIAATANDTPSRLAVGANGTMLVANSVEATGLKWTSATDQFPWQVWTPIYSNLTVGNGTVTARYQQIGKLVNFSFNLTFGSTTAITGGVRIEFPVQAASTQAAWDAQIVVGYEDANVGPYFGSTYKRNTSVSSFNPVVINTSTTYATITQLSSTVPFTWTTSDDIMIFGTYEAA